MLSGPGRRWGVPALTACVVVFTIEGSSQGAGAYSRLGSPPAVSTKVVRVDVTGKAHGSVVSVPRGIDCDPSCKAKFLSSTEVALVAGSTRASMFVGWKGDCVGSSAWCVLWADRDASVTATFKPAPGKDIGFVIQKKYWLYVTVASAGGSVVSEPRGLVRCPSKCKVQLKNGARLTLRAVAKAGTSSSPVWESHPPGLCRADRCDVAVLGSDVHVAVTFRPR